MKKCCHCCHTPKKSTAAKKSEENVPAAPKAEKKTPVAPTVILQSPFGGEITVDAVKTLVGEVDKVYVRIAITYESI